MRTWLSLCLWVLLWTPQAFGSAEDIAYNTAQYLDAVIMDSTETPLTGKVYTDMTVYYSKNGGTWTAFTLLATDCATPTSGDWCEEDATNVPGKYKFYVPTTLVDTKGVLRYIVKCTGCTTYWGRHIVKTYLASDESDKFPSSGTIPNTTTVMDSNVTQIGGDAQSASDLKDFADQGYDPATDKVQGVVLTDTVTTLTNLPSIPNNWLTNSGIADGAISAAKTAEFSGTVVSPGDCTTTATQFDTTLAALSNNVADRWKTAFVTFTSGALSGQTKLITGYNVNGCITVSVGFTSAPSNGDSLMIVNK